MQTPNTSPPYLRHWIKVLEHPGGAGKDARTKQLSKQEAPVKRTGAFGGTIPSSSIFVRDGSYVLNETSAKTITTCGIADFVLEDVRRGFFPPSLNFQTRNRHHN